MGDWLTKSGAAALLATMWAPAIGCLGAELVDVTVEIDQKRYTVQSQVMVYAPIEAVFEVLADYDQFERVSSIFKDSRYIERDDIGNGVVFTQMRDCVLFFCKTIDRTENIEVTPPTSIVTRAIPEKSDVKYGLSNWVLEEKDGATRVTFRMQMEPDFWVPPVVGPYFIRKFLREGSADAAQRLENFALELAPDATPATTES
ncbi:MAG: SRPBCC family protein [Gammaproteobacteria bacterium]